MRITFYLLILLELAVFLVFLAPVFLHILNAGNLAGMAVSLCALLITLFHNHVFHVLRTCWQTVGGKITLSALTLLLTAGLLFVGFCSVRMAQYIQNPPDTPCTVIVLGCKVKGTVPSLMLQRRLDAAAVYLEEHPDIVCIVSGGKGTGEEISEAQAMQTYLLAKGIDADRILLEDRSTDTQENLAYSKEILAEQGLSNHVTLITDGFHQYRAHCMAKALGLQSWSVSGKTRRILIPTYWVREWMALLELFLGLA